MVLLEPKASGFKPKAIVRLPALQMMVVVLVVVVCGWGDACVIGAPRAPSRSLTYCYCMVCKCVAKMQLLLLLLQPASLFFFYLVRFGFSPV